MSKSMIEKIKNFSLVALFLSTVLLLYFFWGNISFERIGLSNQPATENIQKITAAMIKPDKVIVNFGDGNYTVLPASKSNLWSNELESDSMTKELSRFGQAGDILVEEIAYAKYQEVMRYRSINAAFTYNIPTSDFCKYFHIEKPSSYDAIETITSVGYSIAVDNSIFIYDGKNRKYYRLVADGSQTVTMDFPSIISAVESQGYVNYYPVSSYTGEDVENSTLVPQSVESNLSKFEFRQDTYTYQTDKIIDLAESFFGENFDFVRKIKEENGTLIYMYGYGQNVLIVDTDGSVEYKEEQISSNQQGFLESLKTAVQYVSEHGSWESLNGARLTPYLKTVISDPNKKKGYQFIFGMEINGTRLFYEEGDPIVVNVTDGQVTYYKRNLIDFDQEELDAMAAYSSEDAFSSVNLIAQNYLYIYNVLLQYGDINTDLNPDIMFESIAAMVTDMQTGYLRLANEEAREIIPVWIVSINDTDIYFDLYSAEPVSYSKR